MRSHLRAMRILMAGMLRNRSLRRATALLGVTTALATMLVMLSTATALSPSQRIARDLGAAERTTNWGATIRPGVDGAAPLALAMKNADARGWVQLRTPMELDNGADVWFLEAKWGAPPFAERYELRSGRWPTRPGEVAVTQATGLVGSFTMMSGTADLRVVGHATDRFATRNSTVMAAPGTWAALPPDAGSRFPTVRASPVAYWSGGDDQRVINALAAGGAPKGEITANLTRREDLDSRPVESILANYPLIVMFPQWILPLTAALVFLFSVRPYLSRFSAVLGSLGVPSATLRLAMAGATAAASTLTVTLSAALGLVLGSLGRLLLPLVLSRPVGPWIAPTGLFVWALATALTAAVIAAFSADSDLPGRRALTRAAAGMRRLSAGLAPAVPVAGAVILAYGLHGRSTAEDGSYIVLGSVLLATALAPLLLTFISTRPSKAVDRRLANRILRRTLTRATVVTATLTLALGMSIGVATMLASVTQAANDAKFAPMPAGQVLLNPTTGTSVPTEVRRAFERESGLTRPVSIRTAGDFPLLLRQGSEPVWSAATQADIETWAGAALTPEQERVLRDGGVLTTGATPGDIPSGELLIQLFTPDGRATEPVPTTHMNVPREWAGRVSGITLDRTYSKLGGTPGPVGYLYSGLSEQESLDALQAANTFGYDSSYIWAYTPPEPTSTPVALTLGAWLLAALGVLLVTASARVIARDLRAHAASLSAVGVPDSFLGRVVVHYVGLPVVTGVLLAVISSGVAMAALVMILPATVIVWAPPMGSILGILALSIGGAALGGWSAARQASPTEGLAQG